MTKVCHSCRRQKPVEAFHKNVKAKDGRQSSCKVCQSSMVRRAYQEAR